MPEPAHPEQRVHLVEEDHDRHVLAGLLACTLEDLADLVLGLADVLVQELGPLHVEEVGGRLLARFLLDALGERVRDRLRDQRLAAARRPVEQDALGRMQLVLGEDLGVQIRQLDRVAQDGDLFAEPADLLVGDVGHLLERDLFDRRLRHLLEGILCARVDQDVIADLETLAAQRLGEHHHAFLVGVTEHDGAPVAEHVHDGADLATRREARAFDHVEGLVQHDELTVLEVARIDVRMDVHAHLLAVDDDLGSAVLVGAHEHAVAVGRRAELVDLLLEELDLLLRLLERSYELLVLALRVTDLVAQQMLAPAQGVVLRQHAIEATTELRGVAAEEAQRLAKVFELVLETARGISSRLGLRILAGATARRRDTSHHVSNEATAPGFGIELAHRSLSCGIPRCGAGSLSKPAKLVPRVIRCPNGCGGREPHAILVKTNTVNPRSFERSARRVIRRNSGLPVASAAPLQPSADRTRAPAEVSKLPFSRGFSKRV